MLPNIPTQIRELVNKRDYRILPATHRVVVRRNRGVEDNVNHVSFRINAGKQTLEEVSEHVFSVVEKALPYYLVTRIHDVPNTKNTHQIIVRSLKDGRDSVSKQKPYVFSSHSTRSIGIILEKLLCHNKSRLERIYGGDNV